MVGTKNWLPLMMSAESEYHSNFASAQESARAMLDAPASNRTGQADPFSRIGWFAELHRHCLTDHEPLILSAQSDADGTGCWLFLMCSGRYRAKALANWYSFRWCPLWTGDPTVEQRRYLLDAISTQLRRHAACLTLSPLPSTGDDAANLVAALRRAGWRVAVAATGSNHWLEPQGRSFADWWAGRPGALRSTVHRKGKKGIVAISIGTTFSDADWDDYEHVYRSSWKPPEASPDFLRAWARAAGDEGTLRLGIARIDGEPVAAQFWTVDQGTAYIHKLAHISGHDAASPGTLLTHALFAHAFDVDGVSRIDFGTGDDGYKRDWMEQSAPLLTLSAWNLACPAAWPNFARHCLSRLARRIRGG